MLSTAAHDRRLQALSTARVQEGDTEVWLWWVSWEKTSPPWPHEGDISRSCGPHIHSLSLAWSPGHHHPTGAQGPLGSAEQQQDSFMMTPEGSRHLSLADGGSGPMVPLQDSHGPQSPCKYSRQRVND